MERVSGMLDGARVREVWASELWLLFFLVNQGGVDLKSFITSKICVSRVFGF